ncbi:MAG: hypothetical protein V2A77_02145 [Pseudomonadota bacterium]
MKKLNLAICLALLLVAGFGAAVYGTLSHSKTYSKDSALTEAMLDNSFGQLFTALGAQTYTGDNYVTDDQTTTASIDALDTAAYRNLGLSYIHGLEVTYKDGDEVYVGAGDILIHDGTTVKHFRATSTLTKDIGDPPAASTVYYLYIDPSTVETLVNADIEVSTTAPPSAPVRALGIIPLRPTGGSSAAPSQPPAA